MVPYVLAVVALEEGPHMLTNLVDVAPEAVAIGMPVVATFAELDGTTKLPLFKPSGSAAMSSVSGKYAIVGVGDSDVGRHLGRSGMALHLEAMTRAWPMRASTSRQIDGLITRPSHASPQFNYSGVLAGRLGISPSYFTDAALGGASSASW